MKSRAASDSLSASSNLLADIGMQLYSALLSDALDYLGVDNQALPHTIRPIDDTRVMVGRARTAIYIEVCDVTPGVNPYELEIELVDSLAPGEVAVMACGGSSRIAPWGGLLSTAGRARGAAGCLTDGFVRDIRTIRQLGFPVFARGIAPLDSKGRGEVRAIDVPVICAGVKVCSGDLVFGDADGVVVVPARLEKEALQFARDKLSSEDNSMQDLRDGKRLADVFAKYKVL